MAETERFGMDDTPLSIARDVSAIEAITAVPSLLKVICRMTGMGFAAVARVTDGTWTACAVEDLINFGLLPGGQLPLRSTLCFEARAQRRPIVFDHASADPVYQGHHTPLTYNIESYISVPIVFEDGNYFGNLCAIDPLPHAVNRPEVIEVFERFAAVIAMELEGHHRRAKLEEQLLNAEQTAELREQFVAVLSHDLKNPISALAHSAESLTRAENEPRIVAIGESIRTATDRMSKLVSEVLDFTRARLGGELDLAIVGHETLSQDFEAVVAEFRLAYPHRGIHARIEIDRAVHCDPARMQQLVSYLLSNALASGIPDQPVMVEVDLLGESLEIAVLHEGEPIPAPLQVKMFQPYWRNVQAGEQRHLGLGLYICDQIVKAHDGKISVNSSSEGGTLLLAQIPIR